MLAGGLSLSELATEHLKNASGIGAFTFLTGKPAEQKCEESLKVEKHDKQKNEGNNILHFDDLFEDEEFDFDSLMKLDDNVANGLEDCGNVIPSSFGGIITRNWRATDKTSKKSISDYSSFKYANQLREFNICDEKTMKSKPTLFPKPKRLEIKPFDFSEPSPDDIIVASQMAVL